MCVCVRERCLCAPPPSSRMWLKSEAEQRRADRFIMRKWNCSDNDDNCGGPSEGGRTAPGGHWGCVTRSLIDGREMMCVSGEVKNDSGFCVSRDSTEQAKSWMHEHHLKKKKKKAKKNVFKDFLCSRPWTSKGFI